MADLFRKLLTCCLLLACAPACRSTDRSFLFYPAPLEMLVQSDDGQILARALLSVPRGVQPEPDVPARMLASLRIENETDGTLELLAGRLLLVDDSNREYGPPEVQGERTIAPRSTTIFELAFPYPEGVPLNAPDLRGLNLRFSLRHAGGETTATGTLERSFPPDPENTRVQWTFGFGSTF